MITQGPAAFRDFHFDYSSEFRYRWTRWSDPTRFQNQPYIPVRWLHSSLIDVPSGGRQVLSIGGRQVQVSLPLAGGDVRGMIIADPCFTPPRSVQSWISCRNTTIGSEYARTVSLLNSALAGSALDFWMMLGDNFYDQNGALNDLVFQQLSLEAKQKVFATVVGNHDIWVGGGPSTGDEFDQHGIGTMQYFPMDPAASLSRGADFLDFSVDPDKVAHWNTTLNSPGNLVWYYSLGSLAFIGYSGAFPETVVGPYLDAACSWLSGVSPSPGWVFLVSHWDGQWDESAGCNPCPNMDVVSAYSRLLRTPGCAEFGSRLKYFCGHTHQNNVMDQPGRLPTPGFRIGGFGAVDAVNSGFAYVESIQGRLRVLYFELEDYASGRDNSARILDCISRQGLPGCTQLGLTWFDSAKEASLLKHL